MARVPLPERGQPIDVAYLYQMAQALNDTSDSITPTTYDYTTIDTPSSGKQNIQTSKARIIAATIKVSSNAERNSGTTQTFSYPYNGNFLYAPVVTATPVNSGSNSAGNEVTVVIDSVNENTINGTVRFPKRGKFTISINLIIIGIPRT